MSLAAAEVWNLICADGEFVISFHPSGFDGGYALLVVNAHRLRVGEVEVVVADLADVIRSKESAGHPKDLRVLPRSTGTNPRAVLARTTDRAITAPAGPPAAATPLITTFRLPAA